MKSDFDYLNQYSLPKEVNGKIVFSGFNFKNGWKSENSWGGFTSNIYFELIEYCYEICPNTLYDKVKNFYHVFFSFKEAAKSEQYGATPFFMLWWLNNALYYASCALHTYVYDTTEGHSKAKEKSANEAVKKFNEHFK